MLEVLQFIFSSFWTYFGTLLMLIVISEGVGSLFKK